MEGECETKLKICFITTNVFTLGGVQRVLSVLANELVKDYSIDILCTSKEVLINRDLYNLSSKVNVKFNSKLLDKSIISRIISKFVRNLNKKFGIFNNNVLYKVLQLSYYPSYMQSGFVRYLNSNNYDVIIAVEGEHSILLGSIANKLNAKTIGWQHNSYDAYLRNKDKYYWKQDILFKKYISELDKYIVLTNEDKRRFKREMGLECITIYNPLSFISSEKSKCTNKNILSVSRLVLEQKGLDLLIKSFKKVAEESNDWTLTIVGDGEDREKLIELINNLGLREKVHVKGATNNVREYYLNSSIFVSSSRWEGFGLTIIEAMECGLPVVAFENTGPKEIINNNYVNGILVPCENLQQLSNTILGLIKDENRRKNISIEAVKRAKEFNSKSIVSKWKYIFYN